LLLRLLSVLLLRLLGMLLLRLLSMLLLMIALRLSCLLFVLCEGRSNGSERQKQGCYSESCEYFHEILPRLKG